MFNPAIGCEDPVGPLLGHYSAGFTLDTYEHISTQMWQDAAQKVGGFLRMNM